MEHINLKIPKHSYFFGFAQADGHLKQSSRNKGRLQIEIAQRDKDILQSFQKLFPLIYSSITSRVRDTNFKKNYKSYSFNICNWGFRKELNALGIPYGKKSKIIAPPKSDFCEKDYIRGLVDGDGSIGITGAEFPFISIVIKSEILKDYLFNVIKKNTGERKKINRNARDDVYNIMINKEKAQQFIQYLYYPGCLALKRKLRKAEIALKWTRPKGMRRVLNKKFWENWEDEYILNHNIEESCDYLKRTKSSVSMRLWRFKNNKIKV